MVGYVITKAFSSVLWDLRLVKGGFVLNRTLEKMYTYKLIIPALLIYGVLFVAPSIYGIYYSLTDWTIGKATISFIGLKNFETIFQNSDLRKAIYNTFLFAILAVVFKNLFGLLLALAVNVKMALRDYFRVIAFLPCVISTIVIGLIFVPILHPDGFLNSFLQMMGLGFLRQSWLANIKVVMFTIAGVSVWQWSGYHMIIYLAGLQGIPKIYYEAAKIDGANAFQRFRKITFPLLAPSVNINLILSLIGGLKVFSEPFTLTNGGPGHASQVIALEVFTKFGQGQWGLGTALNVALMIFVSIICIPLLYQIRKREVEE
jgi:raffinose/stachyose/melibiose transport system permease protein